MNARLCQFIPFSNLHKMCGVRRPIGSILGSHFQRFFPQLPSEGVLKSTEDKHHPLHEPGEWDLLLFLGFGLLLSFRLRFRLTLPLPVSSLLNW